MAIQEEGRNLMTEYLAEALVLLLEEKPISSITVSELTRKAGVSRMTYYRNFSSMEEIFERYIAWIIQQYEREVVQNEGFASYIRESNLLLMFHYFSKYQKLIRCLLKNHLGDYLREAVIRSVVGLSLKSEFDQKERLISLAYANALYGIMVYWMEEDMRTDPKELSQLLCALFQNQMRRF
ncbi:MAG: TetR/AcrR family transcriptional regulator [Anaerovoracaceae bacterium]